MAKFRVVGELIIDIAAETSQHADDMTANLIGSFVWPKGGPIQDVQVNMHTIMEIEEPKPAPIAAAEYAAACAPPGWYKASNGSMAHVQRKDLNTKTITLYNDNGDSFVMSPEEVEPMKLTLKEIL